MSAFFLSRIELRRDVSFAPLIRQSRLSDHYMAGHQLLWSLFADSPERKRDFLWRQMGRGYFMVLSAREPHDANNLFEIETRPFDPALKPGDKLGFMLRANATVTRSERENSESAGKKRHSKRCDVVMDALYALSKEERKNLRWQKVQEAGRDWLEKLAPQKGFALVPSVEGTNFRVDAYEQVRIPRSDRKKKMHADARFGVVDLVGVLTVKNPELFRESIATGLGRAKAFGCGLMMIRPII